MLEAPDYWRAGFPRDGTHKGTRAMTQIEIANLEHAGRSAFGWSPEGYDGKTHFGEFLAALVPAVGILAVAGTLLLAVL